VGRVDQEIERVLEQKAENLSLWQEFQIHILNKKIFAGKFQKEGWSGEIAFYVFYCWDCGEITYDYPHGFIHKQYLICGKCEARIDFVPYWAPLAMLWELIRFKLGV